MCFSYIKMSKYKLNGIFLRRPMLGLLFVLIVCIWIWRISIQEPSTIDTEVALTSQYQSQSQDQHQLHQSVSFSSRAPKVYNYHDPSRAHENGPNDNITNYFKNSYLKNNSYNLNLVSNTFSPVRYEDLPKDDISNLIDLHNFEFIINQKSCREPSLPLLLIFVHSAPGNYHKRLLIRETWGSITNTVKNNVRLIFLLAAVSENKLQQSLEYENLRYSDIVQGNFIDNYRNMTYKHVMALKWFTYYCPKAKYILKADDDVFVNTPNLVYYLSISGDRRNLLFCHMLIHSLVERNSKSKWRVSPEEFAGYYYPPYCGGYSIVYSPDVAFRLYLEAQKRRYFWIDDVHVTGILRWQANITIKPFKLFLLKKNNYENILSGKTNIYDIQFLFAWPDIKEEQTRKLWKLVKNLR